jgi:hypothetical protein
MKTWGNEGVLGRGVEGYGNRRRYLDPLEEEVSSSKRVNSQATQMRDVL